MNTGTMDESSGSFLLTTSDLAKTSPSKSAMKDMTLLSLTNAVRSSKATGEAAFPAIVKEADSDPLKLKVKVSELTSAMGNLGLAKHVGHHEEEKNNTTRELSMSRHRAKSCKELSPRRASKMKETSPRRQSSPRRELSPRRESSKRLSPKRDTSQRLSPRRVSSVRHVARDKSSSRSDRRHCQSHKSARKERVLPEEKKDENSKYNSFDLAAAADLLAAPAVKEDKAAAAASFLMMAPTAAAAPTADDIDGIDDEDEDYSPSSSSPSPSRSRRSSPSRSRRSSPSRRSIRQRRTSRSPSRRSSGQRRSHHHHDSLDRKSNYSSNSHNNKRDERRSRSECRSEGLDRSSQHKKRHSHSDDDDDKTRRHHHQHRRRHGRRTQSQPEGGMAKPANARVTRRVQSQPEGGALEEAAAEVVQRGRQSRGGRSVRGARSSAHAIATHYAQQVQTLQQEINSALQVGLAEEEEPKASPPRVEIEEGTDLNKVDFTSLDADAISKLLARSTSTRDHSNNASSSRGSANAGIVMPIVQDNHHKDTKESRRQNRRNRVSDSVKHSSRRHIMGTKQWLADDE